MYGTSTIWAWFDVRYVYDQYDYYIVRLYECTDRHQNLNCTIVRMYGAIEYFFQLCLPDVDCVEREQFQARYRNIQHCRDELQSRFKKEYLALLVARGKSQKSKKVKVGDVVLVGCDQKKRIDWPMGLVREILPGKDGQVRVVRLKTATGILLRPVQRLYQMEISQE